MATAALAPFRGAESLPGDAAADDAALLAYARARAPPCAARSAPAAWARTRWPWWTAPAVARLGWAARGRRLGDADDGLGQHQRNHHDDRRARSGNGPGRTALRSGGVALPAPGRVGHPPRIAAQGEPRDAQGL